MRRFFIFLLIAFSLPISFGFVSSAETNRADFNAPTPTPSAKIEEVELDREEIFIPCGPGRRVKEGRTCDDVSSIKVKTSVVGSQNDKLQYYYTVSGGRIIGTGASVSWDLSGIRVGTYTITVAIGNDSGVYPEALTETIKIKECNCIFVDACPALEITAANSVKAGETVTLTARVSGGFESDITYNWTVSQGTIAEGQGTPQIKVKTSREMAGGSLTAALEISSERIAGICERTATQTVSITK